MACTAVQSRSSDTWRFILQLCSSLSHKTRGNFLLASFLISSTQMGARQ